MIEALTLLQDLIRCESITPRDAGCLDILESVLTPLGFTCIRKRFQDVDNFYARRGTQGPNLCFAGHTDVVPVQKPELWSTSPFGAEVRDGNLYGRGTVDMKGAIACFVSAISQESDIPGSISFLLTSDEEGPAIHGTVEMLKFLAEKGEKLDACLVGEPTSSQQIGDTLKIGRRGSLNANISVIGKSGHAAYPHLSKNPIHPLVQYMNSLLAEPLDQGTDIFEASSLQIVSVDVGNHAFNVIPEAIQAKLNIRFNSLHTKASLIEWLQEKAKGFPVNIEAFGNAEAFYCPDEKLVNCGQRAIEKSCGFKPTLSTNGGTSDARFIKDMCPVIELGLKNATAHQVDEHVPLKDLEILTKIYVAFLEAFY